MTPLAEALWHARQHGGTVARPDDLWLDDAYKVQAEIAAASGMEQVGFKVGSTSVEAQRKLGTDEPGAGPLFAPVVHASPATIAIFPEHLPAIEGEFAVRLGRDVPPRDTEYSCDEVTDAIEAITGAIEVVGTRFEKGFAKLGRALVTADGGANIAFAHANWATIWRDLDLADHEVIASINGEERKRGTGQEVLGHPFNVLQWLANKLSADGRGLKAGQIVSTGTCTGLIGVKPGDTAVCDFGGLGTVEVQFTEAER